jgi:hypothetical protein
MMNPGIVHQESACPCTVQRTFRWIAHVLWQPKPRFMALVLPTSTAVANVVVTFVTFMGGGVFRQHWLTWQYPTSGSYAAYAFKTFLNCIRRPGVFSLHETAALSNIHTLTGTCCQCSQNGVCKLSLQQGYAPAVHVAMRRDSAVAVGC